MASVSSEQGESIPLNLMPMLDIFSILILFLLMSFSTDPISHDLHAGVELPETAVLDSLDETPTLILSESEILANDKKIVTLINRDVEARYKSQGAIFPLFKELEKMAEANRRFSKVKTTTGSLTMEVDKEHRFRLLRMVMLSAQQADFVKFKLMASKNI
ncbi:MAG: biopolymer transporter ExbD [Deltaproteobacteria bacterium]|nr:biopolymer transporter ExbD [Deltaproteobacteria bacterium]